MVRFLPLGLCSFTLLSAIYLSADARPRGDTEARWIEHRVPNQARQTQEGSRAFGTAQAETTWFGGTFWAADSGRWEALIDSVWTFDSGVGSSFDPTLPDVNPYKTPGLHTYMEGWVGKDWTYSDIGNVFRRLSTADFAGGTPCVGDAVFGAGIGGNYSFWAGVLPSEAAKLCWATGQGYGNNWNVCLAQVFSYSSGGVTLEYDFINETELGWDYTYVYVDTSGLADGSDNVEAGVYTGVDSGHETVSLIPGAHLPTTPKDILISFCFTSDGAWSDEDGKFTSACGAFVLDNISITGGGITHSADFETGDDGWSQLEASPGPGGDWSNIVHLNDLPPPLVACECDLEDSVLVFENLATGGHSPYQDNVAISPWINLNRYGLSVAPQKLIKADYYASLPLLNYSFFYFQLQYYPEICPTSGIPMVSDWRFSLWFWLGGTPQCTRGGDVFNFSSYIPDYAEEVRIGIGLISICAFASNCTGVSNTSPWFDNVQFGMTGNPEAPYMSIGGFGSLPVDNFPQNGTLNISAPGRIDTSVQGGSGAVGIGSSLNDNQAVTVTDGENEVRVQFSSHAGPGIDPVRYSEWVNSHQFEETRDGIDWYSARMDTAENFNTGDTFQDLFITRYHEEDPNFSGNDTDLDPTDIPPPGARDRRANDIFPDDLFTPGSRLNMFYKARFVGSSTWFVTPDTSGGNYIEVEILPSSMAADSTFNCVLYIDAANHRWKGTDPLEAALADVLTGGSANFENTGWDRYDILSPQSFLGTFGRPLRTEYGASVTQAAGYQSIIWNTGIGGELGKEDAEVLIPWLTLLEFQGNSLYLTGDNLATTMRRGVSQRRLLEDIAGVDWTCDTFREAGCPPGSEVSDSSPCVNVDPVSGANVASVSRLQPHLAQGNGCPDNHFFDVLAPNTSPNFGIATPDEEYAGDEKVGQYASITNDAAESGPLSYKTVVDGFSVEHRREPGTCDPDLGATGTIEDRLREVLTWFGHVEGTICADPTAGTGVTFRDPQPTFKTGLANFAPNPLMPGMIGQIRFTMAREAKAHLDIFDINGRRVRNIFNGTARQGVNEFTWDGSDEAGRSVASGVYFYRLKTGDSEFANKLVVVRGVR